MESSQSASTASKEESLQVAQSQTVAGHDQAVVASKPNQINTREFARSGRKLKESLTLRMLRTTSIDSDAESHSTDPSSFADSSGRTSPVSIGTATSSFFPFDDEQQVAVDDQSASDLRGFSSFFHTSLRGPSPLARGVSYHAHKNPTARSNSASDTGPMPKRLHRLMERSPRSPSYTFPLSYAPDWPTPNSPNHPASTPVSAPESRRGSIHIGPSYRPRSRLSTTEPIYGGFGAETSDEPEQLTGDSSNKPGRHEDTTSSPFATPSSCPESKERPMDDADATEDEVLGFIDQQPSRTIAMAYMSDSSSESATPSQQRPVSDQTEDICELILRQAFNVELQDVDFAADALDSVARCLEELSYAVNGCGSIEFTLPVREVPTGSHYSAPPGGNGDQPSQSSPTTRSKKRPNNHDDEGGEGPSDDEEDDTQPPDRGGSSLNSKKRRREPPETRYPCPYRRRNPLKFNIRDHTPCATRYFSDFTSLKRHVKVLHTRRPKLAQFVCIRCGFDQGTRDRLMTHVQLPPAQMCVARQEVQDIDPEEGVTHEVADQLNARKNIGKIDTWPLLWQILFGSDEEVPSPDFVPPVEWDEVNAEFESTRQELTHRVNTQSKTSAALDGLKPEAQDFLAANMESTCRDYIEWVLASSRLPTEYNAEKHRKQRRSQKSTAAAQSSLGHSLLQPPRERYILPRPVPPTLAEGLPIGRKLGIDGTDPSSLSSSYETAISNKSWIDLQASPASTSLTTPGEPQPPMYPDRSFIHVSAPSMAPPELYFPASVGDDGPAGALDKGKGVCLDGYATNAVDPQHEEFPGFAPLDNSVPGATFGLENLNSLQQDPNRYGSFDYDGLYGNHQVNYDPFDVNDPHCGSQDPPVTGSNAPS